MTPVEIEEILDKIGALESALAYQRAKYLKASGWKYSCETPGSAWLWVKTIDGVTYGVPEDIAIYMQGELNPASDENGNN